ncbi:phosphotransferase [Tabrizicola sp.]|uniref:phosphotransferase enzyme family protein n=1 Tax=Tabrizicola sp. TaxID=2005166 RepID=UPI00286BFADC|nr:phosphotransferase [Tabrizicola sp.]
MTRALAAEAAAHWGGTLTRLLRDRENVVYEIALPQGRAALRLHRTGYQDPAAIRSELWWCDALARAGVPVPAALPARDGSLLVTLSNGRHASVIAWMDGDALGEAGQPFARPAPEVLRLHHALGQLLAQLHRATDALTLPEDFTRPRWDIDGLVGENPFWGRFWDHAAATPDQSATLRRARDALRDRLADHSASADIGLIHADVLRENILVNGHSLSLIDFDDSGFGFRLYDLGTVLSQNLYEPAYPQIRDALMAGYGTTDTAMVETFTLARTCASVGWTMPRLGPGDPVHKSHIARAVMCANRVIG